MSLGAISDRIFVNCPEWSDTLSYCISCSTPSTTINGCAFEFSEFIPRMNIALPIPGAAERCMERISDERFFCMSLSIVNDDVGLATNVLEAVMFVPLSYMAAYLSLSIIIFNVFVVSEPTATCWDKNCGE